MRPIRSLLFAPANQGRLIDKWPRYSADAFAIDLEDATPETDKAAARASLGERIARLREDGLAGRLFVRTNAFRSPHFAEDLTAALDAGADGIVLPKVESVADLERISGEVGSSTEGRRRVTVVGLIETALGVTAVEELARTAALDALAFGAEDFASDMRGSRTEEGLEVLYARSRVVLAARAAGIGALDQAFLGLRNDAGFRRDAELGRRLGYEGKLCVVPRQVDIANEVFTPSAEEVERSRRLIELAESAGAEGRGVLDVDGGMVDEPVLRRARSIVELAERLRRSP